MKITLYPLGPELWERMVWPPIPKHLHSNKYYSVGGCDLTLGELTTLLEIGIYGRPTVVREPS